MKYDLVGIGEPLLRLSPPKFCQLRRANSLDLYVVGSQLNVTANLARLGKKTAFLTKLPHNPLGFLVLDACRSYGIDVSHIKMIPEGKMGVTYVEFSVTPRPPVAIYDRRGSAASTISADDYLWEEILSDTKFAYTDGVFTGLSSSCFNASLKFFEAAKRSGCETCFDVNYREHLWAPSEARNAWVKLLPRVDILVTNRYVSESIFGYSGTDEELMQQYVEQFGCKIVCLTNRETDGLQHGAWSSKALTEGRIFNGRRVEFDIVDRYGTGDAWLSGFIYDYSEKNDVEHALNFGNALCALAHTVEGDIVHVTPEDVMALMDKKTDLRLRR